MTVTRVRGRLPRHSEVIADIPSLIEIQLNSYQWFREEGLRELFKNFSPIEDFTGNLALSFCDPQDGEPKYYLGEPKYDIYECRNRDATFEAPLKARIWLHNRRTGEIKESEVYLGELPIMTENGTFVINGAERCVVSQLARSPGVYFRDTIDFSGRILYSAQIIPSEGAWLDIDTDANDLVSVKIGQAHKFPVTTLLRALNSINLTPDSEQVKCGSDADLVHLFGHPETPAKLSAEALIGRRVWERVVDRESGEVIAEAGERLGREAALRLVELAPKHLRLAALSPLIDQTMERDPTHSEEEALIDIYRRERPGDPVTPEIARNRLAGLFADNRRYDLARVGRYKLNKKLGLELPESVRTLTKEDLIAILDYLVRLSSPTRLESTHIEAGETARVSYATALDPKRWRVPDVGDRVEQWTVLDNGDLVRADRERKGLKRAMNPREDVCWACAKPISTERNFQCPKCGWLICTCGECKGGKKRGTRDEFARCRAYAHLAHLTFLGYRLPDGLLAVRDDRVWVWHRTKWMRAAVAEQVRDRNTLLHPGDSLDSLPGDLPAVTKTLESVARKLGRPLRLLNVGIVGQRTCDDRVLTVDALAALSERQGTTEVVNEGYTVDEIDHLMNKRVRCVGELLQNQFRIGFLRMERICRERMTSLDPEQVTPQSIISTKPISAAIKSFFGSSQLSQFLSQENPLSALTHKRRLSALGPGGLSRQSAKLEVRDVHHSHYGRICPIETPEGPNIGLIGSLATYARLDEHGFIETPYRRVRNGVVTAEVVYLTADEEDSYRIAPASTPVDEKGRILGEAVSVRYRDSYPQVSPKEIDFMDLSPKQLVSIATCLIPFLENDDANRALMGSNMQRQAVPLLRAEAPFVKTGVEARAAQDSGAVVLARADGLVTSVTAEAIQVTRADGTVDTYRLQKFVGSNQGTCINQRPLVRRRQFVTQGQVLADGPCTDGGELALGRNTLVAFMPWEGYNYEDAIVLSERLVRDDVLSSIHIEKYEIEARETKVGPEEITRDIPNVGDEALRDLDEDGVVRIGAQVRAEDILVGKVAPKGQEELTSEEKLVRAIFGEKAAEMRDTSLRVPHGEKGKVVEVKRFSRIKYRCQKCDTEYQVGKNQHRHYCDRCGGELRREPGDELLPGVNQLVRVYVAQKRKVMEGDKLAGRHGNKGVVAKILPEEDMPFLPDGTPVDIILNPLGVPSRMNIGQILETHLGLVAEELGVCFENPIFEGATDKEILEYFQVAAARFRKRALHKYLVQELHLGDGWYREEDDYETTIGALVRWFAQGDPADMERAAEWVAVDPAEWEQVHGAEARARYLADKLQPRVDRLVGFDPATGKCQLFDGRSGEPFNQPITVGHIYTMKLAHLVDDKIHARSTGPYSLVTQQPLGGKAQFGGQRFGEMEVWALEAYGAAHTLQEILTIKSDDVLGRVKTYESIVKGEPILEPGIPESFKILIKELQSLGLQLTVESKEAQPVDLDGHEGEEVLA